MKKTVLLLFVLCVANEVVIYAQNNDPDSLHYVYLDNKLSQFTPIKDCLVVSYYANKNIDDLIEENGLIPLCKVRYDWVNIFSVHYDQYALPLLVNPDEYDSVWEKLESDDRICTVDELLDSVYYISRLVYIKLKDVFSEEDVKKISEDYNLRGYKPDGGGYYNLETWKYSVDSFTLADILFKSGMCDYVTQVGFGVLYDGKNYESHVNVNHFSEELSFCYFNLHGQPVESLVTPGVYIQRGSDGTTKKVLVK